MGAIHRRAVRVSLGILAGVPVFCALAIASSRLYWLTLRETLKFAERVGVMDPKGNLGGQVMGFNYQRDPAWVYPVGQMLGAVVSYGPVLVVCLLLFHRLTLGRLDAVTWGRCGKCGTSIAAAKEPKCAACGAEF